MELLPLIQDFGVGIALTVLIIYNVYDRFFSKRAKEWTETSKQRAEEHAKADALLSKTFKGIIAGLELKIQHLSNDLEETNRELATIKAEYATVIKIFQGRDDGVKKYQEEGLAVMKMVREDIYPMLREIKTKVDKI